MRLNNLKMLIYPQNQAIRRTINSFFIIVSLGSCVNNIEISGFDSDVWKRDFKACTDYRANNAQKIVNEKSILIGKHENSITKFLGHPTRLDLGKKMTRSSYYAIENINCEDNTGQKFLVIDYNSLSQVKLVMIQNK